MSLIDITFLALALAMDCFTVSIVSGVIIRKYILSIILRMAILLLAMMMSATQAHKRLFLQVMPPRATPWVATRLAIGNKDERPPALTGQPEESQNLCAAIA